MTTTQPIEEQGGTRGLVLALGGGGAAGIAHIGVLQVLEENAIPVRAIAGTSVGAEIGAFAATGTPLDELAALATSFDWKQTLQLFMPDLPTGGFISGKGIVEFLQSRLGRRRIERLAIGFVAIATDLNTGEQTVLDRGSVADAVRASVSVPGIIKPFELDGRLYIDGGVVNPLPFDVARERFGGPVVAVAVDSGSQKRSHLLPRSPQWPARVAQLLEQPWMQRAPALRSWLETYRDSQKTDPQQSPVWTARRVLERAMEITEAEMVRQRARRNPPDLILTPDVREIGVLEFYRAREAIEAGRAAAQAQLATLQDLARAGR
jgi:NTE family protein